jgi:hypothetical protein
MSMRAKDWDVYLRWRKPASRRKVRLLSRQLSPLVVTVEGVEGQLVRFPTQGEIEAIFAVIRRIRGGSDDVRGAIVPRGHRWQSCRGLHRRGCDCQEIADAGDYNTLACRVAETFAHDPPAVVWPDDKGLVEP